MSQDTTAPGAPEGIADDARHAPAETVAVVQPGLLARLGAEVFGTFFLVLAIVGVAMWVRFFNGNLVLAVALAGGLALLAAVAAVGHVSGGHFNPAVTLGAAIGGRTAWRDVLPYWIAQLVGALLAGLVLLATIPRATLDVLQQNQLLDEATTGALFRATANGFDEHSPIVGTFGGAAQQLGLEVTLPLVAALLIEVIATALFVGVILGVTDSRSRSTVAPVAIGLALGVLILVAAPFTNASLNPARSTVSAVFGGDWALSQLWVFWVAPLLGAAALLALFGYLQRGRGPAALLNASALPNWVVYLPLACAVWALVHASGVHATIAGVALGLLMRTVPLAGEAQSPSHRVEHLLSPCSSGLVLPVFALMSAGVVFTGFAPLFSDTAAMGGIMVGLVLGKTVGIAGGSWVATKLTSAELNPSLSWIDLTGMAALAGVGFTVSLLITELSFSGQPEVLAHAKAGVLLASLIATLLAAAVLSVRNARYRSLKAASDPG